jgi:hypothetical protein
MKPSRRDERRGAASVLRWKGGTTHVVMKTQVLMERQCTLV